ncbi:FadR/GntR family transcriptional regulator [Clostridium culturomicium]|uniref:FadR/GntR family transcriptional regulator n=1 Tax=Clostridium culturomicium TaxID=1499683 RepID=UPI000A9E6AF6|nr:FadR/GntR family transcriptional regulator [Clostridium culturomicium]
MTKKKKSLVETVSDEITKYIMDNELQVGDKIPNEFELAEKLNVGRSTVREAIKALVSRNVLEVKRGSGTFISSKAGVADDPLGLELIKDRAKLAQDLLEVRFMIEPEIASIAATKATEEEIERLQHLCDEVEQLILHKKNHRLKDIEFHTEIAKISRNQVVATLIPIIDKSIEIFIELTKSALEQETIETHREIFEAIKNKDPKGAHDAMYLHLVYNRRNLKKADEIDR